MNKKIKNFFLVSNRLDKKELILVRPVAKRSLWFGALLFFVIFGLFFSSQPALAQVPEFSCQLGDLACYIGNFVLSVMIKIVILTVFGIPLLLSALFVGIMALILGWIIGPDFISLKFTQNPFVDIGLSITRNFANMGFIIFLVVIALATALRIKEYKAKKTLPTLILIALLINFSPVFCGFIIDASNIVMNFFLTGITGLTGFANFLDNAARSIWNLLITSTFNVWENIAAAMQILIMIFFNAFAGYIFILFSALFIVRYIMLWILVILSPIAFVSYILPITRRGRSLLSWREWWAQLVAWSIIGIIAAFFLYLGFTMISMINASPGMFVTQPDLEGLGLMNNVLPYLIPLIILLIAYKEIKRTRAMFARATIAWTERITKAVAGIPSMAALAAVTAAKTGGMATMAMRKMRKGTAQFGSRMEAFSERHPTAAKAMVVPAVGAWASRRYREKVKPAIEEKVVEPVKKFAKEHPRIAKATGSVKRGLKAALWGYTKKEEEEGRELTEEEKKKEEAIIHGKLRKLTPKELTTGHVINVKIVRKPGAITIVKEGFERAWKEFQKEAKKVKPLAKVKREETLEELRDRLEREEEISEEEWGRYEGEISEIRERRERGEEVSRRFVEELLEKAIEEEKKARPPRKARKRPPPKKEKPKPPPKEEKPPEKKKPPTPPSEETGEWGERRE